MHPTLCCPTRPLPLPQNTDIREVAWMFWILLLLLLASRAAFVLPVTLLHNRYNDAKLTAREMATIWWAGLMRGAVSGAPWGSPKGASRCMLGQRAGGWLSTWQVGPRQPQ